ncbi:NINE protein [Myroides sp. LJL116]
MKSTGLAYVLLIFFGYLGIHKFYLDKNLMGILYIFTFGFLGIGLLIDLFTLGIQVRNYNRTHQLEYSNFNSRPQSDIADQLSKLNELRRQGVITDREFSEQKARILR